MTGKLTIFWDYELQKGLDKSMSGIKETGYDEFNQTEKILELCRRYGVKCVFAVVGFAALKGDLPYHARAQVAAISSQGHEVASHSMEHELLCELDNEKLRKTIARSKEVLESATGKEVLTFVPPHNMPFQFLGLSLYWKSGWHFSRVSQKDILKVLKDVGYRNYRFHRLSPISKITGFVHVSDVTFSEGINCYSLSCTGFGKAALKSVKLAIKGSKHTVVYGHPHSTLKSGPENLKVFESFLKYVSRKVREGVLEVVCPGKV